MCMKSAMQTYMLKIDDLLVLPECADKTGYAGEDVAILIGNAQTGVSDCLLSSREELLRLREQQDYVETSVYFYPVVHSWNLPVLLIGKLRKRFKTHGTHSYRIKPQEIKRKNLIRCVRTKENAYQFSHCDISDEERCRLYEELEQDIVNNGWNADCGPLSIMLCRSLSYKDSLDNGNHRINICLEHNIPEVTVSFCYAGKSPRFLIKLLEGAEKIFAFANLAKK